MADGKNGPDGSFVGRERELQLLQGLLAEVGGGGSAAVAIMGEPGIGKTRLLSELAETARTAGFAVFAGRGSELEPEIPFGLAVEALDSPVAHLDPEVRARVGENRLAELGAVLPSLPRPATLPANAMGVERFRCYHAVQAVVEELSRQRPVLLVFDDVHWADPASLELVSYLLRRKVRRCLFAIAYRRQTPRLLAGAVGRAVRDGGLQALELGALSAAQVTDLLGDEFGRSTREALYQESGGNPFYLHQLVRASRSGGSGPTSEDFERLELGVEVPAVVRTAIAQELALLSPTARTLAQAAAVAGDPFEFQVAREIAGLDEPSAYPALDELIDAEAIRPTGSPGRLRFRHPIVRRAVHSETAPGWRLQAHQRAAAVLAERGAPIAVRAQHVLRSGASTGDEAAIALLVEAGQSAASRAPAAAASWYAGAARLLAANAPADRHLSLLLPLANVLVIAGRLPDGRAALTEALARVADGDGASRRFVAVMIARLDQLLGHTEEALDVVVSALAEAEPGSLEAGRLTLHLARNQSMLGQWGEAAVAAAKARELAEALDDRELLHITMATSASLHSWGVVGEIGDALVLVDEAAAGIDDMADDQLTPTHLEALVPLVFSEINVERWQQAEAHADRGIRLCRASGEGFRYLTLVQLLALVRMLQGRLLEARRASDTVFEATQLVNNDHTLLFAAATRCWLTSLQGQTSAALAAGQEAVEAALRVPDAQFSWMAHVCYGMALVEAGQHEEGRRRILVAGGPDLLDAPPASRPLWFRVLAEAELAAGRIDEAETAAEGAETIATRLNLPMRTGDARYARAATLIARGDHERALETARQAAASYEMAGVPLEAARSRMLAACALVLAGDIAAASEDLDTARTAFETCGAVGLADRATRELRRLGISVKRTPRRHAGARSGPAALSTREREVAGLAAQGCTNRQIAEALFLSRKTVETHLAHIFAKLGVSSRGAMTTALREPSHH